MISKKSLHSSCFDFMQSHKPFLNFTFIVTLIFTFISSRSSFAAKLKPDSLTSISQNTTEEENLDELEGLEFSADDFLDEVGTEASKSNPPTYPGLSNDPYAEVETDIKQLPKRKIPTLSPETQIIKTKKGKYIYHPNQEKGLYKINRENEYLYKYDKSPSKGFFHIKGGSLDMENFPSESSDPSFEDLYSSTSLTTIFFEYEWRPFKKHKYISVKAGSGISYARGRGRFLDPDIAAQFGEAEESYTFMLFPFSLGLVYKFEFTTDQLFLPFISGALDYNIATEFRSGFEAFKYSGILGAHFGGGVLLNMGWLERAAALELDKEFGVNNTYLSIEGRQVISFSDSQDLTGFTLLIGLSFEY